ncbi:MAG: LysM domain-containing protein [Nocardioides sp.]|nr:LysM domain-containing protein [Nocardioides sp.]
MNGLGTARRTRCLLVWVATTAAVMLVVAWCAADLPAAGLGLRDADFDRMLVSLSATALTGCCVWWWLVTSVVVVEAWRDAPGWSAPGVPAPARRWVLAACGVALVGAGAAPAAATPGDVHEDDHPLVRAAIAGLPLPERPLGGLRVPLPEHERVVVVAPGDSLWSLAATALGAGATDAEITAEWQRIHQLNREVVGADPDLIRPGQRLVLPPSPPTHP